ncbi:hypothetical protein [Hymenobacter nivis]|uniref:hypothetical protein n=1 Tax=Hymenobacter nivis TaxID=1850093 RepID=UPI001FEAE929|nr:hypothetical protein [Hymenobacter nivis]
MGILFYFPEQRQLEFRFPDSSRRLRRLYSNFSERQLKVYLQSFSEWVARANKELYPELTLEGYEVLLRHSLLDADATVLRFAPTVKAVPHSAHIGTLLDHYYDLYFSEAYAPPLHERTRDEGFLLSQFRNSIKHLDPGAAKLLKKDVEISVPATSVIFDYAWQNGTFNLVKPISFDLKNENEIHKKALFYYGNLNLLADKAKENQYRFDILVARPTNPKLSREYNRAVSILKKIDAPSSFIVEDEELQEYSKIAARNLREHYKPTDTGLFLPTFDN